MIMPITPELVDELLKDYQNPNDLPGEDGLLQQLTKALVERARRGVVTTITTLGASPRGIAFDGSRIWTANSSSSVSIVSLNPVTVTTVRKGFSSPDAILYDGAHIWATD